MLETFVGWWLRWSDILVSTCLKPRNPRDLGARNKTGELTVPSILKYRLLNQSCGRNRSIFLDSFCMPTIPSFGKGGGSCERDCGKRQVIGNIFWLLDTQQRPKQELRRWANMKCWRRRMERLEPSRIMRVKANTPLQYFDE
jgi:hypothetical protein